MIKRFDINYVGFAARRYCADGEYVDAEIAAALYEALENLMVAYKSICDAHAAAFYEAEGSCYNHAKHALARARGES